MKYLILILALFQSAAHGFIVRDNFQGTRPLGMGNAFLALSDDNNALWYNPAGLAHVKGMHFNVIDGQLGVDSVDTFNRMFNAILDGDYNNLVRSDTQFMRFSLRPQFITPYFSMAFYDNINGFFEFRDLESLDAQADVFFFNDIGLKVGFGIPFGEYFSAGIGLRVVQRTAVDAKITTQDLFDQLNINAAPDFQQAVFDNIQDLAGTGWAVGADVGVQLKVPTASKSPELILAAVIEDVGNTQMRTLGTAAPPQNIPMSYHLGAALKYAIARDSAFNIALDLRHLEDRSGDFIKNSHFGMEYTSKIFAVRGGLYQGYPTAGLSIKFPPHTQIHLSTHGVELGNRAYERSQRWYQLQLIIGFNPL